MHRRLSVLLIGCVCLCAGGCQRSGSQRVDQQPATPAIAGARPAPTAAEILQRISRRYADMQAVQVDVLETISLDRSGTREIRAVRTAALVARPNRISLPAAAGDGVSFHADGKHLWTVLGNRFSREPCPETLAMIAEDPIRHPLLGLSSLFLLRLLGEDPQEAITRDVQSVTLLADEVLDGQLTHRLQFTQPEFDWELWVTADEPRLVQQIVIDMSKQLGVNVSDDQDARITTTIRFRNWRIDPRLDETSFAFRPAEDSREVDHVMGIGR